MVRHTLSKHEIVRSRQEIDEIFTSGSSFFQFPFRVIYSWRPGTPGSCRVLFAVSRRHVRLATDRNLIKRRMREIYRQNKHRLLSAVMDKRSLSVALVYVASDKIPYTELENKLNKVLLRLIRIAEV